MHTRTILTTTAATAATLLLAAPHTPTTTPHPSSDTHTGPASVPDHAVISQAQSRSQHHQTVTEGNAVEIANPTDTDIDLAGWSIRVYNSASTQTASITLMSGDEIPAGASILIHDPDFEPTPISDCLTPGQILEFNISQSDTIADQFGVALYDDSGNKVDSLATVWGITDGNSNQVGEDSPATALASGTDPYNTSLQRDVHLTDTDNNHTDFRLHTASWGRPSFC